MKKLVCALLSVMMLFGTSVYAKIGDKVGEAINTDIIAYINNYAIPSYAVNGTSSVVAEDLKNFGFNVLWDAGARTLVISRNNEYEVHQMSFKKTAAEGSFFADVLETDIGVFANGKKITSYAINGYTMIPVEELSMFGEVYWVESERALKLWVEDLHIRDKMQPISKVSTENKTITDAQKKQIFSIVKKYVSIQLKSPSTAIWPNYNEVMYWYNEDGKIVAFGSVEAMNGFGGYGKVNYMFEFNEDLSISFKYVY